MSTYESMVRLRYSGDYLQRNITLLVGRKGVINIQINCDSGRPVKISVRGGPWVRPKNDGHTQCQKCFKAHLDRTRQHR